MVRKGQAVESRDEEQMRVSLRGTLQKREEYRQIMHPRRSALTKNAFFFLATKDRVLSIVKFA